MSDGSEVVVSELVDLTAVSMDELRHTGDEAVLSSMDRMLQQVQRVRKNLGGGGPPGRVD